MTSTLIVHTHSEYKADEYPLWFEINGIRHDIITIEDRWYDESYESFKIFADDSQRYILRNWIKKSNWDLIKVH